MIESQLNGPAMLMNMGRYDEAERRLRQVLLAEPQNADAHILLAHCLLEGQKFDEATNEAETAVGLRPDESRAHYALARVWYARRYPDRAERAIEEAVRLDPYDSDYHSFRAALLFERSRWQDALVAAEAALAIDPEHVAANNFRAMALVKLGRRAEAGQTIDAALARSPEDAFSHANKGWALLEARKPQEALVHFREALRLDPNFEYARLGIIEALKARNPIYGLFLRYALWMVKLPPKVQIGVLLGAYFGNRMLVRVSEKYPALEPYVLPVTLLYIAFAFWTWLARPIFNLLLRIHPLGKHALSRNERMEANSIGGLLAACVALFLAALVFPNQQWIIIVQGMWIGSLALPIMLVFRASPGWPRKILLGTVTVMVAAAICGLVAYCLGDANRFEQLNDVYCYLWVAMIWGGQLVASVTPRR